MALLIQWNIAEKEHSLQNKHAINIVIHEIRAYDGFELDFHRMY